MRSSFAAAVFGACLAAANVASAEATLGVSASEIIAHAVAAKAVDPKDRITKTDAVLGTHLVVGSQTGACFRLTFVGNPRDVRAIIVSDNPVCTSDERPKGLDAIGRIIGALAPKLPTPPQWQLDRQQVKYGNPNGSAWYRQFTYELVFGGNWIVTRLERVLGKRLFIFEHAMYEGFRITIEPAPKPGAAPPEHLMPYPDGKALRQARDLIRQARYREAVDIIRPLADEGDGDAVGMLGNARYYGWVGQPSVSGARFSYGRSASIGSMIGAYGLGVLIPRRLGRSSGYWLTKAVLGGHPGAQVRMAMRYATRRYRIPQMAKRESVTWCSVAAWRGNVFGQICTAAAYVKGDGLPQDPALADFWLAVAQRRLPDRYSYLQTEIASARRDLTEKLTPAQRSAAEANAAKWQPLTMAQVKVSCHIVECPSGWER